MKRTAIMIAAVVLFCRSACGEEPGPNYPHLKQIEGVLGRWTMSGEWTDGKKFVGEEASEWCLNQNFIQSRGWFSGYDGQRVDYHIMTGWDPAAGKIVEWFSFSDGGHSRRVGTYDQTTRLWSNKENGVNAHGQTSSFDVTIQFVDKDTWTWKGTNGVEGGKPMPDLNITFTRAAPASVATCQQWIKYLAGKWTTTDQDGVANDELLELASGGRSLLGRGKFVDGVEYTRQIGWQADSQSLVETWYLSSGIDLVNRYREIDERKCTGQTTISNEDGQTAHGTITREKISDEELRSVYRGRLPGETEEVEFTWISKRR